ncbi:hypothetical protein [Puniceicoccus vermicola]|uniref:DUF4397 domain-containing protein n=1 Tax=Puniceicoccus vermicola TaxID=388746 RepID=A0A7X1AZG2_9BACT|nr:hypothetical protein [Puniceicoccus vermicola]MBC2602798.1 hypothetical protein [Puniceicoccus vermicola]
MAYSRRNLIKLLTCVTLAVLSSSNLEAQREDSAKTFRTLGVRRAAPQLFYKNGSEEIRLFAGDSALSGLYEAPPSGKLTLYCYMPAEDPDLPPVKVDLAETELKTPGESLVLVATMSSKAESGPPVIRVRTVDASVEKHPLNTARVFNFSNRKIASKVAEEFAEIPSGGEYIFDYPTGSKMWVKIAAFEGSETGWKLRNGGPKAIIPGTRSLIVLSDAYPSEEDPYGERINLRNVIDSKPPPPITP